MPSVQAFRQIIQDAFTAADFIHEPRELTEPIDYSIRMGGKRLRPLLVLLGCDLFGGEPQKAIHAAMAMEIFHNFTLLHDDLMDQSPLRRGKETVYKKWSSNTAILSGDTMLVLAYSYLTRTDPAFLLPVLEVFNDTARQVCEGQQYDMNFETRSAVSLNDYLKMIRLKTAVLLACCLKTGALIAGAPPGEADKLYAFGENLGLAFQLQDDYLDVFGDPLLFGKETGGDIITNKKTFLYLKAFELAREDDLIHLTHAFFDPELPVSEKVVNVTRIYKALRVDETAQAEIVSYVDRALKILQEVQVDNTRKSNLKELAQEILGRER